jgi:glycosyltransferase involved in cell wall biosynthesis
VPRPRTGVHVAEAELHIAIDGRELAGRPTGVGRYLHGMMREWAASSRHRFSVVLHAEPSPSLRALGDRFSWIVEPDAIGGTWWEQLRLPQVLATLAPDVLFSPAYTAPLRTPVPFVLVVHDVSFCAHPEWFSWREGFRRRRLTRASAHRARRVITVSDFSRQEIARHLGIPADRMLIAPAGSPTPDAADGSPRQPVVLYVGSLFNRRRPEDMIRGFARAAAAAPDARFILVGDNRTSPRLDPRALAQDAGVADRLEWREYVSDVELAGLYRSARALLFLSDYEGFGIPPLEAIAHGVPPVVLDTPASREVYGDGAIAVPPDPAAIGAALTRLLTDDAEHARVLAAGRARLAAYSWSRSAATIAGALEEAGAAR